MADGTNIGIDPEARQTRITEMDSKGQDVSAAPAADVDKGGLTLDGLNQLIKLKDDLNKIVLDYGKLIVKDAGILKTISDNFSSLDNSVNG